MKSQHIELQDIKSLVVIDDYSYYYFLGLVFFAVVLLLGAFFLVFKWLNERKKENIRKKHLHLLGCIDLTQTKEAAYAITKYGATFKDDDTRHQQMYKNLQGYLAPYKYKKDVEPFDEKTRSIIQLYKEMCDV